MNRTYFFSSIQVLETLFKENNNNLDLLRALQEELVHRKTERAARLRTQVTERLAVLIPGTPSRKQNHPVSRGSIEEKSMKKIVQTIEKTMVMEALTSASWVQTKAADILGISERMLRYKMKKFGIIKKVE